MSKPIIAVDIDEVLGEFAVEFVKFSNEKWGTNLSVEDYHEHWSELWRIDHAATRERADMIYSSDIATRLTHVAGAKEALGRLKDDYDIVLVTSRPLILEKDTRLWLEQNYSNIASEIYFAGMYDGDITDKSFLKTKATVYSQINPVFVIDDQPKHCQAAADLGIRAILFGNYPWNQEIKDSSLITRCNNWDEVLSHINLHS